MPHFLIFYEKAIDKRTFSLLYCPLSCRAEYGGIAQLARAFGSYPKCHRFESYLSHERRREICGIFCFWRNNRTLQKAQADSAGESGNSIRNQTKNPPAKKENSSAGGSENRRRISPRRPLLPAVRHCDTRSARRRCPPASPAASESSGSFLRQAAQPCSAESCPLQRSGR